LISTILAKRYAKALFSVAKEEDRLDAFSAALQDISSFLSDNPDIEAALENPVVPPDIKLEVTEEIIKASGADDSLANFLRLLTERGRIQHLGVISDAYQELMDEETGVVRAIVKTAVPLSEEMHNRMKEIFSEKTGKQVALVTEEDPDIIGGVVAYVGDKVWDGSIRSQLDGFKESIGGAK
jgi:F-type H+-transporting ATPase subunit delta